MFNYISDLSIVPMATIMPEEPPYATSKHQEPEPVLITSVSHEPNEDRVFLDPEQGPSYGNCAHALPPSMGIF